MSDSSDKWRKNTSGSESWLDVSEFAWICSSLHNSDRNLNTRISCLKIKTQCLKVTAVVKICQLSVSPDFYMTDTQPILSYSFWASMEACSKYTETAVSLTKFTLLISYCISWHSFSTKFHRSISKNSNRSLASAEEYFLQPSWALPLKKYDVSIR